MFNKLSNGPDQYHFGKTSKSSSHVAFVSVMYYDAVVGLLITLLTLTLVGACPNKLAENT